MVEKGDHLCLDEILQLLLVFSQNFRLKTQFRFNKKKCKIS